MTFNDFKQLFLNLTGVTVPYGSEYLYYHGFMKNHINVELIQRGLNFYYVVDGSSPSQPSKTLFCCHLDTADPSPARQVIHQVEANIIRTDGTCLLGADDKAGVATLIHLIEQRVPGTYYFFAGEEIGGIGSRGALTQDPDLFNKFDRAIAFDRKGQGSIISRQQCSDCCSSSFVSALSAEFSRHGLTMEDDPTGSFTDTATFMDVIPECTNLSIGYHHAHTTREYVDIDYAYRVAQAAAKVDWENLPAERRATF